MPASSRKLKRAPKRMARSTRSGSASYAHSALLPVKSAGACTAFKCAAQDPGLRVQWSTWVHHSALTSWTSQHCPKPRVHPCMSNSQCAKMHISRLCSPASTTRHMHWVRQGARTVHEGLRGGQRRAEDLRVQVGQAALREVLHLPAVDAVEQAVDGEVAPAHGSACSTASDAFCCTTQSKGLPTVTKACEAAHISMFRDITEQASSCSQHMDDKTL